MNLTEKEDLVYCCAFCTTTEAEEVLTTCKSCGRYFCLSHGDKEQDLCEDCI